MATAADDSTGYGGGAGGKFRRRPFRKPQTTPYDRPPTALRITRRNDDRSSSGGWLSRIVDPASKLITASAHKLFSSVFRKRLLPPPQPSKDEDVEPLENHFGDAMTEVPSSTKERDTTEGNTQNGSTTDGVAGLANILKKKTFTRQVFDQLNVSEIDHLTALLHSREVVKTATQPPAGQSRHNEIRDTAFENGFNPFEVSGADLTPAVRMNVNVGDVASPIDLAKAYMGSMSTSVSPSTLGSHSQAVKEGTTAFTALASHRSSVSIVQKPLTSAATSQKGFVVPRSRGRSAIYSMARTPYFKAQQTVTNGCNDAFHGNPLSSSQKTLKRRSSALESDIGSVGPIRRIRQKPNLLYPKTLGLPSSCTPSTSATPSGVGEASSSKLHEGRGEKGLFSNPHVSSQSIEMGQRILQQLEKLTPPKDKYNEKNPGFSGGISSMKLTPAMLSGQARKSLETVESLKYVQGDEVCEKKVDSWDTFRETQDSITNEQDKFYNNSSKVLMNSSSNAYPENGDARSTDHDVIGDTNNTAPIVINSTIGVPKKSPAFQMSAYEDDLDMDEDAYVTPSVNEGKIKLVASYAQSNGKLSDHPSFSEASKVDRPVFPKVQSSSNSVLKNATTAEVSNTAEKGICHDKSDLVLNNTIGSSTLSSQPVKASVADNADFAASTVSFDLKSSDKASLPSFKKSSAVESSVADVTSSSFAFGAASAHAANKSPGSDNNSSDAVGLFKQADTAQTSVPGSSINTIGSFGSFPLSSTAPSPLMFSSPSPFNVSAMKVGADGVNNSATATPPVNGSSDNVKVSVAFPSLQSTFGGSPLSSDSATMAAPGTDTTEKSKGTDLGNSTSSNLFGAASVHPQNSAASSFQFGAPVTSDVKSQLGATDKVSNGSIFGDQTLPSPTASVLTTERVTSQPASSLLSGSAPFSSSFAFGSSSLGSSTMAAFGSVSSASTNIFGGTPQSTSSPVFSSTSNNSSAGLSFGVSASTPSSSASSAFSFGTSSISAPANGSSTTVAFGSSSASTAAPSGSASSGFTFGTSSISAPASGASNGGSTTSSSLFGFGASSSTPSTSPSSTLLFGTSPATASSSSPTSTFSFGASPATATSSAPSSSTFSFGASLTSSSIAPSSSAFISGASSVPLASSSALPSTFSFGVSPASSSAPSSTFSFGASPASSSAPSSTFSFGASPASSSAPSSTFSFGASPASSSAPSSTFSFGASPASSSAPSSTFSFGASPASSSAPSSTFSFGASPTSSSAPSSTFSFGASPASSSAQSPAFSFGASSATTSSNATPSAFLFGASSASSTTTTTAPVFPFSSTALSTAVQPSQPAFGTSPVFGFGSTPSPSGSNNDQMSMEDSMVEDSMHQSPTMATPTPVFGQSPTNFSFGMAQPQPQAPAQAQLGVSPFQFGGQQNQVAASPNPFQASGSFDGGSFSLGAGGNDKSNRRIVKEPIQRYVEHLVL
ncbi:hypothetical protein V2J09_022853 [Rumex salicifolius]